MAVDVFGGGPVQPAIVSYRFIDLTADLELFWANSYLDTTDVVAANMNVDGDASYDINMPDATQVGVGMQCVFNNIGANVFYVYTNSGNTLICSVVAGASCYLYLTDNTTTDGIWSHIASGSTTSTADAGVLAGYGLKALPNPPGIATLNTDVVTVTTNDVDFNPTIANRSNLIVWTGGADDITLPALVSGDAGYYVSFNNQGSGLWRILPTAPALFDGETDIEVNFGQSLTAVWDGTDWYSLGFGQDLIFPFTVLNKNISGNTNVTLTAGEGANEVLQFNHAAGDLTGDVTIFMPSRVQFQWVVYNNTTGAFDLSIQQTDGAGGGTGTIYIIPQGNRQTFYNDGTTLYDFPTVVEISDTATFPSGTLAAPGIAFTDSPSTGLRRSAANTISVVAGAVDGIVVTDSAIALEHTTAVTGSLSVTESISVVDRTTTFNNIAPLGGLTTGESILFNGTDWVALGLSLLQYRSVSVDTGSAVLNNPVQALIPGMTRSITPDFIANKVLGMVQVNISSDQPGALIIYRDATPIAVGAGTGITTNFAASATAQLYTIFFVDTPASVAAVNYSVHAYVTGGGTYYLNSDMGAAAPICFSSISLFDIGGF